MIEMASKYTISFQVEAELVTSALSLMLGIEDLLITEVAPAIGMKLVPLSFTIKKASN
jgi:hypothetical protein